MRVSIVNVSSKSKKKRVLRGTGIVLGLILISWVIIFSFPVSKQPTKPFFEHDHDRPLVIAHQGGEHLAPSNTLVAFEQARELGVDVLEFDLHMSKDGHLVVIHDATVDRTTDGGGRVNDLTLEQLKTLDAGYYFQDANGEYSYRDQGITIPTIEEVFQQFSDMKMNIELKKTNDPALYPAITEKFWSLIQEYGLEDQILVASFSQEMIEMVTDISNGRLAVSGGRDEVNRFAIFHKLFLNSLYRPSVDTIQIPTSEGNINLKDKKLIRGAANRGMELHYWTINDVETMKELIELGADGIITDRPDLLIELLQ